MDFDEISVSVSICTYYIYSNNTHQTNLKFIRFILVIYFYLHCSWQGKNSHFHLLALCSAWLSEFCVSYVCLCPVCLMSICVLRVPYQYLVCVCPVYILSVCLLCISSLSVLCVYLVCLCVSSLSVFQPFCSGSLSSVQVAQIVTRFMVQLILFL